MVVVMKEKLEKIDGNTQIYIILTILSLFYLVSELISVKCINLVIIGVAFLFILFIIAIYFLLMRLVNKKLKIESYFLLFSIFFGVFYIFGFPPSQLPDDQADYLRTLEISNFDFVTPRNDDKVGRYLNSSIHKVYSSQNYGDVIKNRGLKLNNSIVFYDYSNKALYSFVCYIPQVIGFSVSKMFNVSIFTQSIFGKVFNYIFYVILVYFSIKYIPIKKDFIFFISLIPLSLQEGTSLAPDAMMISTVIGLVSFIVYQRVDEKSLMTIKNKVLIGLLAFLISLCKIVYLPLIFLIFLIPSNKFKSKKDKNLYCVIVCILSVFLNLLWLSISSKYLDEFRSVINPALQLKYIIHHPLSYFFILFRTINSNFILYLQDLGCGFLGNYVVKASPIMIFIVCISMFKLMCKSKTKEKSIICFSEKIFVTILVIITVLLIFTSLYIQWTSYKVLLIDGIQGRYFIPLIPIVSILFMRKEKSVFDKKLIYITFFVNIMALIAIYTNFI